MENISPVLLALCGLGVVCVGTLFVMLLLILRVTGRNFMSFFSLIIGNVMQEREDNQPVRLPRRKVDLRAKAQGVSFEESLAAQSMVAGNDPTPLPPPVTNADLPPSSFDAPAPSPLDGRTRDARDRLRRRARDYDNDEVFGGLLDDDGDGSPDY